jgi:hypothetical protein
MERQEVKAQKRLKSAEYKKVDKDKGMPKSLDEKRIRCNNWIGRPSPIPSPTSSPCPSDDEDTRDISADAVAGLLGLASNALFEQDYDEEEDI